ncbi:NADH-quinone oxidoreductase subunit C [Streptomyces sp. NBC_01619]|uniref:NADH-quinone oxidoreductase subunit C n=1 Tax=unclassified Streptomyces TaxID=2593676 RepID=UPI00225ABC87|nr:MULTISPECIES: NADH-quinone oxidoreductase subunit C [unclassified Streptomyces]MCX4512583.1 NADH-quinone oxidoreductase subunit C [Streptomyces sp. NBC_01619]
MSAFDTDVAERFGPDATAEAAYDLLTVDVPAASWTDALRIARDELGCAYFDWLSAVDEPGTGFRVCAHVVALDTGPEGRGVRRLLLRTTVPHDAPVLASAVEIYAGAGWHERETYEMFGVDFTGHPHLVPLLLPEGFEGHPLRKDFVLAARVAKAWPGAKEPGESDHGGPKRRQMLPPGVPDPNEWGPLKGQLPPAPARPARAPRAAGDRPPRRTRSVSEGSASQAGPAGPAGPAETPQSAAADTPAGSPRTAPEATARRSRSVSEGSASQRPPAPEPKLADAPDSTAADAPEPKSADTPPSRPRSADAPWHHARPAFDTSEPDTEPDPGAGPAPEPDPGAKPDPGATPVPEAQPAPEAEPEPEPEDRAESGPAEPRAGREGATRADDGETPSTTPGPDAGSDEGRGGRPDDATGGDPA